MCSTKALPILLIPLAIAAPFAAPALFGGAAAAGGAAFAGDMALLAGAGSTSLGVGSLGATQAASLGLFSASNMGWGSLLFQGLGAIGNIYGQQQQQAAVKAQENYNAAIATNNKIIQDRLAKDALDRGQLDAKSHRRDIKGLVGTQRAALAGSGVVVDEDTAAELTADTTAIGEQEARNIMANAEREAYGYRTQANNYAGVASLASIRAKQRSSIFTTALSEGGSVLGRFAVLRQNKVI